MHRIKEDAHTFLKCSPLGNARLETRNPENCGPVLDTSLCAQHPFARAAPRASLQMFIGKSEMKCSVTEKQSQSMAMAANEQLAASAAVGIAAARTCGSTGRERCLIIQS